MPNVTFNRFHQDGAWQANGGTGTSTTLSAIVSAEDYRLGLVLAALRDATATITGVTWGGVSMTELTHLRQNDIYLAAYQLVNVPNSGSPSVVVSASASVKVLGVSFILWNVDPTTPFPDSPVTAQGNDDSPTLSVPSIASRDLSVLFEAHGHPIGNNIFVPGTGLELGYDTGGAAVRTSLNQSLAGTSGLGAYASSKPGATGSVTLAGQIKLIGLSDPSDWAAIGVRVAGVAPGHGFGPPSVRLLNPLSLGAR